MNARTRLTQSEKHKKVVESWEAVDRVREKRARGCMAGLSEEASKLTSNLKPLSTQELIDLVDGNGNEPTVPPSSQRKKAAVKQARSPTPLVTPSVTTSTTSVNLSPPNKYKAESESPFYRLDPHNPAVGYIVFTTVRSVNPNFLHNGVVNPNYVLIGRVKYFINVLKSTRPTHPVDEWEEERVGVDWLPIEVLTEKRDVVTGPILPSKLTVLAKNDVPNLMGLNLFLSDYLNKQFYWDKKGGWKISRNYVLEMHNTTVHTSEV